MEYGAKCFTPAIWFALPIAIAGKEHDVHTTDEKAEAAERLFAWALMLGCLTPTPVPLTPSQMSSYLVLLLLRLHLVMFPDRSHLYLSALNLGLSKASVSSLSCIWGNGLFISKRTSCTRKSLLFLQVVCCWGITNYL